MCGIICFMHAEESQKDEALFKLYKDCLHLIKNRGPDSFSSSTQTHSHHTFHMSSSVLWLQGEAITEQPLESERSTLLYNGDIFNQEVLADKSGDTKYLLKCLEDDLATLKKLQGPYAFVYLDRANAKLYFARDVYGRRSLLVGKVGSSLLLTSVAVKSDCAFIELPPIGIFSYDLVTREFSVMPWGCYPNDNFQDKLAKITKCLGSISVLHNQYLENSQQANSQINSMCCVNLDLQNTHLESGSLNSQQAKCDSQMNSLYCDNLDLHLESGAISNSQSCNYEILHEIQKGIPQDFKEPIEEDLQVFKTLNPQDPLNSLQNHPKYSHSIQKLATLLRASIKKRLYTLPNYCQNCISQKSNCTHSKVGILFSGGLDCTVLALIVDEFVDKAHPIDLMNVAFGDFNTPDRATGLESWAELEALRPERTWNFLQINVAKQELDSERERVIKHLIYPLNTILDDSLGCAIWFASRGKAEDYISPCRVLFVGMGADELFGGYTHHRAALKKRGWLGLHQSLKQDWQNISHRNLGRDDRVVADHGRQLRTPFLDEDLVEFLLSLPPWEKTYPSDELPQGLGEKILLRAVAYSLGLRRASLFKKRAIQFGSRIADKKEKAHEVSPRL